MNRRPQRKRRLIGNWALGRLSRAGFSTSLYPQLISLSQIMAQIRTIPRGQRRIPDCGALVDYTPWVRPTFSGGCEAPVVGTKAGTTPIRRYADTPIRSPPARVRDEWPLYLVCDVRKNICISGLHLSVRLRENAQNGGLGCCSFLW